MADPNKKTPFPMERRKEEPKPAEPSYLVRVPYIHTSQFGGIRRVSFLEYQTTRPTVYGHEGLFRVAQFLGYLDSKFKPTADAEKLKPGRGAILEVFRAEVSPSPGIVGSSLDPRFQAVISPPEDDGQIPDLPENLF